MRYSDDFRDPVAARRWIERIRREVHGPVHVMEVCGGQTHTLIRSGIDRLLQGCVELVHGPGCPVCVTPLEKIDRAIALARRGVVLCSYGDMLRVPGSETDLLTVRSGGADVRVIYSPLDAVEAAAREPDREFVLFAVGFETTAPANGMAILQARRRGLHNFSALVSHVRVPPAIRLVLDDPDNRVQGFLAPGHVCSIVGREEYEVLARDYGVPFVIAGFEPLDLLHGLHEVATRIERGEAGVVNAYARTARDEGNRTAKALLAEVFEVCAMNWRGIGPIPESGLVLRAPFAALDAERRYDLAGMLAQESEVCRAGEVLQGRLEPHQCPAFGNACTPDTPLGAPMVSSEGACAAYYSYRREARSSGVPGP